jgi:hypothetical protein
METIDPHPWRTSTYSSGNGGNCVEVGQSPRAVIVRDTKDRDGSLLTVDAGAWRTFTESLRN